MKTISGSAAGSVGARLLAMSVLIAADELWKGLEELKECLTAGALIFGRTDTTPL